MILSRTQEDICARVKLNPQEKAAQLSYFKSVRRQMTDDICACVPSMLGHAQPAFNNQCLVVAANSTVWPLFFAGTSALERIGKNPWQGKWQPEPESNTSAAFAQVAWIIGRLEFIANNVGLRWARGVAATLRGDFRFDDYDWPAQTESLESKWRHKPGMLLREARWG